ncbi:class C sortase [Gardnerella sp. KA00603]|uniref:Fimbrial associated sortase (Surface protein transpeptidase) n=1 Tax=Gardnerella vaginalis 1500E TaxID=698957 RepID=I4LZI3_GARVA|nr:class C sortase [Gardnerella vaginalis]EIK82373.1 fimbrial associated sortase (surface protein transpeptidase) [Gardnerella vaginalis 1500E]
MKLADFAESVRALFKRLARMRANKSSKSAQDSASSQSMQSLQSPQSSQIQQNPQEQSTQPQTPEQSSPKPMSTLRKLAEPVVLVLIGILCFSYPVVSTLVNNYAAKELSIEYDKLNKYEPKENRAQILRKAREYNARHKAIISADPYNGSSDYMDTPEYKEYEKMLSEPMGIMGIVKIPKIGVKLPIYHGTTQTILAMGAGHLYGTDLPVGGKSRHTVVTAHTGMPDATMFDDLNTLKKGDYFYFDVQGKTLRYKVFRINVVQPNDIRLLRREKGRDLATLITCTPYGINTHRLLVTGYRVMPDPVKAPDDHLQWPLWMTLFIVSMVMSALLLFMMLAIALGKRRSAMGLRGRHLLAVSRAVLRKLRRR